METKIKEVLTGLEKELKDVKNAEEQVSRAASATGVVQTEVQKCARTLGDVAKSLSDVVKLLQQKSDNLLADSRTIKDAKKMQESFNDISALLSNQDESLGSLQNQIGTLKKTVWALCVIVVLLLGLTTYVAFFS